MITYNVDEQSKTITCVLDGEEIRRSAINKINAILRNIPKNVISVNPDSFVLADKYVGTTTYAADEDKPFDVEEGKKIARKKAFAKYNHAMERKFSILRKVTSTFDEEVLFSVFDYNAKYKDICKKIKKF